MRKQIATLLLAAMTLTMAAGCGTTEKKVEGTPAVKVNGDVITQEEIDSNYDSVCAAYNLEQQDERNTLMFKREITQYLIENQLILQEANRRGLKASSDEVASLRKQLQGQSTDEEFAALMSEQKITEEQLNSQLEKQVVINALQENLLQEINVDPKAYYDEHQDQFAVGEWVKASHILVATEDEAKEIIKELDNGADFAELAKEKSTDSGSKQTGGDLGYFTKERMVEEFSNAAFSQEVGTYSKEPVKSKFGYHIIYVTDKKPAGTMEFSEVEQSIKSQLTNQEFSKKVNEMLDQLKNDAEIEYINADLDPNAPLPEASEPADDADKDGQPADGAEGDTSAEGNTDTPADGENTPAE